MLFISPYFEHHAKKSPLERTLDVKMENFLTLIFIFFRSGVIRQSNDVVADNPATVADTW